MTDDPKALFTARPPAGVEGSDVYSASTVAGKAPADLLDLVRSAEESAHMVAAKPSSATKFHAATDAESASADAPPPASEDVIDVTSIAIDAPPTYDPPPVAANATADGASPGAAGAESLSERAAASGGAAERLPISAGRAALPAELKSTLTSRTSPAAQGRLSPLVGVILFLILTVAALALIVR